MPSWILVNTEFRMRNAVMELFSSTRCFIEVTLRRDVSAEDFSESDIAQIQNLRKVLMQNSTPKNPSKAFPKSTSPPA
jgi:hypothetical protein